MFLVDVSKSICTAPFPEAQELYYRRTWKANVSIFLYIFVRKMLFQRRRRLLSSGGPNNFLKAGRCLGLLKCFNFSHFNWNFWKINHFDTSMNSTETLKFPDNLDFKGNIAAKFTFPCRLTLNLKRKFGIYREKSAESYSWIKLHILLTFYEPKL